MAQVQPAEWALVPIVLANPKKINASLPILVDFIKQSRVLPRGRGNAGEWTFEQPVNSDNEIINVSLRFCAPMRVDIPESWKCSLIMFRERIDGICHDAVASDGRNGKYRGWHRHEWDPARKTCKDLRNALPDFDPGDTIETFISACCGVLGVTLEEGAMPNGGL